MVYQLKAILFFAIFIISNNFFGDQFFKDEKSNEIRISVVKSIQDIDQIKAQDILVRSFMNAYENVPLANLNPQFTAIGDVRRFYENYFKEEFAHFQEGHLFWVQAFFNNELAGWATFELEPFNENEVYMNLLIVAPEYQRKGLGKYLTFSVCSEELFPNIQAINLLIRKVNLEGYKFYNALGFFDYDYCRDNFVDTSLLTGLRWERYRH